LYCFKIHGKHASKVNLFVLIHSKFFSSKNNWIVESLIKLLHIKGSHISWIFVRNKMIRLIVNTTDANKFRAHLQVIHMFFQILMLSWQRLKQFGFRTTSTHSYWPYKWGCSLHSRLLRLLELFRPAKIILNECSLILINFII
jgi:hypothetical protein